MSFIGVTSAKHASATVAISTHASTAIGDLLVAVCFRDEGFATDAWTGTPFTLLGELNAGTVQTTGGRVQVWTRTATAAGATAYSYTDSSNNSTGLVWMYTIRDAGTPTMATQNNTGSSTSTATASVGSGTLDHLICGWSVRGSTAPTNTTTVPGTMTSAGQLQDYIGGNTGYQTSIAAGAKTATLGSAATSLTVAVQIPSTLVVALPRRSMVRSQAVVRSYFY